MILFSNPAALRLYTILYDKTSYALLKLSPKKHPMKELAWLHYLVYDPISTPLPQNWVYDMSRVVTDKHNLSRLTISFLVHNSRQQIPSFTYRNQLKNVVSQRIWSLERVEIFRPIELQ